MMEKAMKLIRLIHFFLNRSINIIMEPCYNGNTTSSWVIYQITYIFISQKTIKIILLALWLSCSFITVYLRIDLIIRNCFLMFPMGGYFEEFYLEIKVCTYCFSFHLKRKLNVIIFYCYIKFGRICSSCKS